MADTAREQGYGIGLEVWADVGYDATPEQRKRILAEVSAGMREAFRFKAGRQNTRGKA